MSPVSPTTYELTDETNVQDSYLGERFELTFPAGKHTPKSEVEEYALQQAVAAQEHRAAQRALDEERAAAAAAEEEPAPSPPVPSARRGKAQPDLTTPTPPDPED